MGCLRYIIPILLLFNSLEIYAEMNERSSERILAILQVLKSIPTGSKMVQYALLNWGSRDLGHLVEHIQWGDVSRTDTLLTRKFNPKTGLEDRERIVTIYLRSHQSELEVILDLAHELVHATSRPSFDPYDPTLTASEYVWSAIEGPGGEIDAVEQECQVGRELSVFRKQKVQRCENYKKMNRISREKIRKDFYRVGEWYSELSSRLGAKLKKFPLLSPQKPSLYSSTGRSPYPISLLNEFDDLTDTACTNSQRRIENLGPQFELKDRIMKFIRMRCRS